MTDQPMPVYDRRAWQTYRHDAKCDCTAPDPVDCASYCQPKPTRQCPCHYLSVIPTAEELAAARTTPDNPPASGDAADNPGAQTAYRIRAELAAGIPAVSDDGLREQIAAALEAADYRQDMRRGDLADAILPVVNRRMEQLAAEADANERARATEADNAQLRQRLDNVIKHRDQVEAEREQMRQSRDEWMDLGKNADRLLLRAMARRDRYRDAWKSARIRAARNGQSADRLLDAANAAVVESGRAEVTLAAVRRWAQAFGPTGVLDILDGKAADRG